MLANDRRKYLPKPFDSEAEIEGIVERFAHLLFGESIVYLSQARVATVAGIASVPDALVIDLANREWYLVEVERASHGTWQHIAPQVSRQLAALAAKETRDRILGAALREVEADPDLQAALEEEGVDRLHVHGHLEAILSKAPTVALPIDGVPKDLEHWIETLKNDVKVWLLEKYVSADGHEDILYSLPDDNLPTLTKVSQKGELKLTPARRPSQVLLDLLSAKPELEGERLHFEYGPRGRPRQRFEGVLRENGVEVDGTVYSLSYGAVYCMRKAGSTRTAANGWIRWKTPDGRTLDEYYQELKAKGAIDG